MFLLKGEVIWQASNSSLTKELHDVTVKVYHVVVLMSVDHLSWDDMSARQDSKESFG